MNQEFRQVAFSGIGWEMSTRQYGLFAGNFTVFIMVGAPCNLNHMDLFYLQSVS